MTSRDIIAWLRDQAMRAPEDVLRRGMNRAADRLEQQEEALDFARTINEENLKLKEELERLKERNRWISATEEPPSESDGTVLICFPDVSPYNCKEPFVNAKHDCRVTTARYSEHSKQWYIGGMGSVGGPDPISWRQLPEPAEEAEKNA